ncbi:hypothetical protein LSTR_LSTR010910 [Laodelphax striatellus]|uniref:Spaetzle domain-containing protein n=1 Tax=Laodelphax striatellus TaxID=195883 RepID=A0A482WYA8_LAOST|nr:hypothetical protein LSTR_LSTR010910 [Laodelphax striatellus]
MFTFSVSVVLVIVLFTLTNAHPRRHNHRKINLEDNFLSSKNFKEDQPILRPISVIEIPELMAKGRYYQPDFVVLKRCDYESGYCKGEGYCLRETDHEKLFVEFKNLDNDEITTVRLSNHLECACVPCS